MARTGMSTLITTLRSWCEAGRTDYTVADVTYWTDDQLQEVLDRYRVDHVREPLTTVADYNESSVAIYQDYYCPARHYEEATGGTAVWNLETSTGTNIGTAEYTINYQAGHFRFTADRGGTAYYLTSRSYDVHRAAAEVWRRKAANVANRFDWSTDNHNMRASQLQQHYLMMAASYEKQAPMKFVRTVRSDVNG